MKGAIWVESPWRDPETGQPVAGSAFHFTAQFTMGKRPEAVLREAPSAAIGPLRILVAEDNVVNQKVACHLLEKLGHSVVLASNGRQVVDLLERQCPDVILMDVQMPEMGGLEATAAIRRKEKERGGHIPIIGLTAHALSGDREECLQAGMDALSGEARAQGRPDTRSGRNDGCVPPGCSASRRAVKSSDNRHNRTQKR
jgi:CheY-like chemotaxis protein